MQCPEFEERLQSDLDLRRAPSSDAELDAHVAICAECSAKREFFVQLARLTGALGSRDLRARPGDYDRNRLVRQAFAKSLEQTVALADRAPQRRRASFALAGSVAAVAACLAVCVGLASLPRPETSTGAAVATTVPASPAVDPAAQDASVGDFSTIPAPTVDPGDSLPVVGTDRDPRQALARWGTSLAELSDDPSMTRPLRPIASSFGVAWETVRSALPAANAPAERGRDQANAPLHAAAVTA